MGSAISAVDTLVVSLNFTPGHFSSLIANYRLLEEAGYTPALYVHSRFNEMDERSRFRKINTPRQIPRTAALRAAIFWFPSLKNIIEMMKLRFIHRTRLMYVFHEPFDSIANYDRSGFGVLKTAKIVLMNVATVPMLWLSHTVVLPSGTSLDLYRRKYRWLNGNYAPVPLLFDDEAAAGNDTPRDKDAISYIGTVAADHAFDCFVDFVDAAVSQGLFSGMKFVVATPSDIPSRERAILDRLSPSGRVIVQSGRPLSNDEINAHFKRSIIVWNAYHRTNQSGVLPKAFMFGAAVLSSSNNRNEFVEDGVTGVVVNDNSDHVQIANAVSRVCADPGRYAEACRQKFLDTFYYRSQAKHFMTLLGLPSTASMRA